MAYNFIIDRRRRYCEKTKNKKEYKIVEKICGRFVNVVKPMFTNKYGRGFVNKLYKVGDYIIRKIYMKFLAVPKKYKRQIVYFMYEED